MSKQDTKQAIQDNSTLVLVIVAAVVFAVSVVGIKKAYDDFGEFRELNQHESEVLDTLETNRQNLEQLEEEADTLAEEEGITTDSVVSLLPLNYYPVADMATLEQLVTSSNVQLQDLSVTEDTDASAASDRLTPYQASISASNNYDDIKELLSSIEESAQPLLVEQIEFSTGGEGVLVDVTMTLHHQGVAEGGFAPPAATEEEAE